MAARPYTKAPPIAAPIYNWTGFYIGAHLGAAFGNDDTFAGLVIGNNNDARFLGGMQGGADYQFAPNWVLGVEGQYSWLGDSNRSAVFPVGGYVFNYDQRAIGSITGRLGYTWGPGMIYVKGGYAYSDNRETLLHAGVPVAFAFDKNHRDGWTVGAGLEYMFAQNWSAKAEYQYYDFGNVAFTTPAALAPFGSYPQRRAHREGRHQLPLRRLRRPGCREVLIASYRFASFGKGRRKPAFFVGPAKNSAARQTLFPTC